MTLGALAKKHGVKRAALFRACIDAGIDEAELRKKNLDPEIAARARDLITGSSKSGDVVSPDVIALDLAPIKSADSPADDQKRLAELQAIISELALGAGFEIRQVGEIDLASVEDPQRVEQIRQAASPDMATPIAKRKPASSVKKKVDSGRPAQAPSLVDFTRRTEKTTRKIPVTGADGKMRQATEERETAVTNLRVHLSALATIVESVRDTSKGVWDATVSLGTRVIGLFGKRKRKRRRRRDNKT